MKNFTYCPIPYLLRYDLLLKNILEETPAGHEDCEAIPEVFDIIRSIGKDSEPGVQSAKQKVQIWCYNADLVFKTGEAVVSTRDFILIARLKMPSRTWTY